MQLKDLKGDYVLDTDRVFVYALVVLDVLKFVATLVGAIILWFFILAPHPIATLTKWYKRYRGQS